MSVQQRRFDRRFGEVVADNDTPNLRHGLADTRRIADLQDRREIGVDGELDALRAFFAVAQAADRRAFADPDDPSEQWMRTTTIVWRCIVAIDKT